VIGRFLRNRERLVVDLVVGAAALAGPLLLTAVLLRVGGNQQRYYVFLYLGLVSVVATLRGLWPALVAAAASFICLDYYFVSPVGTLNIKREEDLVNLIVFFGAAGLTGWLASRRRHAQQRAQDLELTHRLRGELLANISHDLRTPIATILTVSTTVLGRADVGADARQRIQVIASEARRLGALVGDMLDLARIENAALDVELEPVHLSEAIAAACERLLAVSPTRRVIWAPRDADLDVLADWQRLGQVFDNLLSNANRFAPTGTPLEIRVARDDAGEVSVRVIDRGPGVPAEVRAHLFDRFVTGDTPHPDPPPQGGREIPTGTGLGLAIVRGLVEAQGGRVELEPTPDGGGTSFRFTLRAAAEVTALPAS
jgi:two-component system sensor histidine kinase KdpD